MDFLLLAHVVLAVLLLISGVAKLRDRDATADAFEALRLPSWLAGAGAPLLLPVAELVLAALLVLGRGWLLTAATAAVLVLMLAYTVVIARALGFDEPVRCGCFGALGSGDVTRATLVRNALLVALAALSVAGAVWGVVTWGQPATSWGWVLVALLSAAAVALSLGGGAAPASAGSMEWIQGASLIDESNGQTVRVRELAGAHGGVALLFVLPGEKAQLLVAVDCLCSPARMAMDSVVGWQEKLPMLDVRLVLPFRMQPGRLTPEQERLALYDHGGLATRSLGATGQVAAVLLGADGMLAGGPVHGIEEVRGFVDDIADEIAASAV